MSEQVSQILSTRASYVASASRYFSIHGLTDPTLVSCPREEKTLFSVAGTLSYLRIKLIANYNDHTPAPPGTGKSRTFRVFKNGASTLLAVTISGSDSEGVNTTRTVSVSPGDDFYVVASSLGTPGINYALITLVFFPTNQNETNLSAQIGGGSDPDHAAINSGNVFGAMTSFETGLRAWSTVVARACTLSDFRVKCDDSYGSDRIWTVYKNEVATGLTVTLPANETSAVNLVDSLSCEAGDRITIYHTSAAASSAVSLSIKRTDTGYLSYMLGGTPRYDIEPTQESPLSVMELGSKGKSIMVDECVVRSMRISLRVAPGVGNSRTFTLVKLEAGVFVNTELTLTISGTSTSGVDNHWVYLVAGDIIGIKFEKTGSPPAPDADIAWGLDILSTVGIEVPTVVTNPCTDRTLTSLTANGNILSAGGYYVTTRGFCYKKGTTGNPTVADDTESEDGEFVEGAYSLGITGLDSGEPYRVRAYVIGPKGTAYGDTVTSVIFPTDRMARVSSIRRVYRPGFYRMEAAFGDLGFDWDVAEAAIKKIIEEVKEPEEKEPTPEEIEIIRRSLETKYIEAGIKPGVPRVIEPDIAFPQPTPTPKAPTISVAVRATGTFLTYMTHPGKLITDLFKSLLGLFK